jgi:serine/threonine-protein phosphatase 2A activator
MLPRVDCSALTRNPIAPGTPIKSAEDVAKFKTTSGYRNYILFLSRLSEAVVGCAVADYIGQPSTSQPINKAIHLLDTIDGWIDEIPPLPTPQRFGNLAFRHWGKRLEEVRRPSLPSATKMVFIPLDIPQGICASFGAPTRRTSS